MVGESVTYIVEGLGKITFGDSRPFFCESFSGSAVGVRVNSSTAIGSDGQSVSSITLDSRAIPCKFSILAVSDDGKQYDYEKFRRLQNEVVRLFNPRYTGTLIRVNKHGTYKIQARVSEIPTFENIVGASCRFNVTFVADAPMWLSTSVNKYVMNKVGNLLIYNNTGEELPFEVSGTVPKNSAFTIENLSSGKLITLRKLSRDYAMKFLLDTSSCKMIAQKSSGGPLEAANYMFTADSDMDITLIPGENVLRYTVDGTFYADNERTVTVTTCDRYVGVT